MTAIDTTAPYPEHEKLKAIADKSQVVGEFVEWLGSKGIHLADYPACLTGGDHAHHECRRSERLYTIDTPIRKLLAEFFDIDQDKIDAEKDAMLEQLRSGG